MYTSESSNKPWDLLRSAPFDDMVHDGFSTDQVIPRRRKRLYYGWLYGFTFLIILRCGAVQCVVFFYRAVRCGLFTCETPEVRCGAVRCDSVKPHRTARHRKKETHREKPCFCLVVRCGFCFLASCCTVRHGADFSCFSKPCVPMPFCKTAPHDKKIPCREKALVDFPVFLRFNCLKAIFGLSWATY